MPGEANDYEPPQRMWDMVFKGIDDVYGIADQNPAEWSIAKSCAFFALGIFTMERYHHILESL